MVCKVERREFKEHGVVRSEHELGIRHHERPEQTTARRTELLGWVICRTQDLYGATVIRIEPFSAQHYRVKVCTLGDRTKEFAQCTRVTLIGIPQFDENDGSKE